MLSTNELASLQNLINDEKKTFEDLKTQFNSIFDKSIHFKLCLVLNVLIKENQLNLYQEISAFFILYCISNQETNNSPFLPLALNVLKETKINLKKIILIDFLKNNIENETIKIKEYINLIEEKNRLINIEEEIKNIELKYNKSNKGLAQNNEVIIYPLVPEKKKSENKNINSDINIIPSQKESLNLFESNYMSYYPYKKKESLFKNELQWIMPMLNHNFIWENSSYEKVNLLLGQVLNDTPLTKDESKYIISSIIKNQNIIKCINFSPKKMMSLIEKDESLSFDLLAILCKTSLNE